MINKGRIEWAGPGGARYYDVCRRGVAWRGVDHTFVRGCLPLLICHSDAILVLSFYWISFVTIYRFSVQFVFFVLFHTIHEIVSVLVL